MNGWTVSGLTRVTTGFPVTLENNNDTSLLGTQPNGVNSVGADEMQYAGGALALRGRPGRSRRSMPVCLTCRRWGRLGMHGGDSSTGRVRTTRMWRWKRKRELGEGKTLELRAEAFNVFNHSQFFGPSAVEGNIGSTTFGQIVSAAPPRLMQVSARIRW